MPAHRQPRFWTRMPFFRLIIPLIAGILLQWYTDFSLLFSLALLGAGLLALLTYTLLPVAKKYFFRPLSGISIMLLLVSVGAGLTWLQDMRHAARWIGNINADSSMLLVTLKEPLVEKAKTYKALASVSAVNTHGKWEATSGNILVYISKDTGAARLGYGSQIIFTKPLQPIRNAGNPGGFDYKEYSAFHNIYHQVYLQSKDYAVTGTTDKNVIQSWLFRVRSWVIKTLATYIPDSREAGVAEALLIGFRDNLDKDLVQEYSNVGVVHIIAISGLHLGLIYGLLVMCFKPFNKKRWVKWVRPLVVLLVLWIFTLLAGAVPSILRSAVMFTFLVMSEVLDRKTKGINTLASSAFVLLCFNPYYLWDIGFQLSYAAIAGIMLFSKHVDNWFYFKNKILSGLWKFNSVTIAAQVFTVPIILHSFHQFPTMFLLANLVVVPLSTFILYSELLLLALAYWAPAAKAAGFITHLQLSFMNRFINWLNDLPFSFYDGISITTGETLVLYVFIGALVIWLLYKSKPALFAMLAALLLFTVLAGWEEWLTNRQQKLVVYNIAQHCGMDFVVGKGFAFQGDSTLYADPYLYNFNLKPSRMVLGISQENYLDGLYISQPFAWFRGKRVLVVNDKFSFENAQKVTIDVLVMAGNARVSIHDLAAVFDIRQVVFDGSDSPWKINQWKKECEELHLPKFSTADEGAFVLNL